jgi:hypothetical protein
MTSCFLKINFIFTPGQIKNEQHIQDTVMVVAQQKYLLCKANLFSPDQIAEFDLINKGRACFTQQALFFTNP